MDVYLSLGSNIGNREETIIAAVESLEENGSISGIVMSEMYLTEPLGLKGQRSFVNCAVRLETDLTALELLKELQVIEDSLGRKRVVKWGPRTIDIDIIFYGSCVIQQPGLLIPHPQTHKRSFVLEPLNELCPDFIHPVLNRTVNSLWKELRIGR